MPIAAQFHAAAAAARNFPALEEISRTLWQAHAAGALSDNAAQAAAEAVEARRRLLRGPGPASQAKLVNAPRRPVSPDRDRSIARRRAVAASGAVPSKIAASFTQGEVAALAVIAGEVKRAGRCELCLDAIAALAGVCRTTCQNALRQARALGLVTVTERPRPGQKSLTNVAEVVSPDWRSWLRLGMDRVQKKKPHEYQLNNPANFGHKPPRPSWRSGSVHDRISPQRDDSCRLNQNSSPTP